MPIIIDLTHIVTDAMPVYPYDEPPTLRQTRTFQEYAYTDWRLCSGMHVGTHIDGPGHLTDTSMLLSSMPIDTFVGTGYLIDARNTSVIDVPLVAQIPAHDNLIVLILTGFDKKFGTQEYFRDYPIITPACAHTLVQRKVKMVGIDCCSPDAHPFPVHKIFFDNNILLLENLTYLERLVGVHTFTVIALPLKTATDSALARVIALTD